MSRESRQRPRKQASEREKHIARRKNLRWIIPVAAILLMAGGAFIWNRLRLQPETIGIVANRPAPFRQPRTFKQLLRLPPEQVEHCDIGLINLLCAQGLPGAEDLDLRACMKKLDDWAERARFETQRHEYRFNDHPEQFRNSHGYFRMMMLGTILAQDLGIRYNPQLALPHLDGKIPTLGEGANSKDVFIHGLLEGNHFGTCASMPVMVAAIGSRLGYPVHLAGAKYHLYVRYEEPNGKHFNVEPTVTEAFLTPDDEDYKNGQFKTTAEEIEGYSWLRPLSKREALAHFLHTRAICLGDAKRYDEAKQTFLFAASFWKETPQRRKSLDYFLKAVQDGPGADSWDAIWEEIEKLEIPQGTRSVYFANRKDQIHYFMNDNSDLPVIEKAEDDFKNELAEYRRQVAENDPALMQYRQHVFRINLKSGKSVRVPAEVLPPPLNRGQTSTGLDGAVEMTQATDHIIQLGLEDPNTVIAELWSFHKQAKPDWTGEASLLPSW
jgi:hypothetical protein